MGVEALEFLNPLRTKLLETVAMLAVRSAEPIRSQPDFVNVAGSEHKGLENRTPIMGPSLFSELPV